MMFAKVFWKLLVYYASVFNWKWTPLPISPVFSCKCNMQLYKYFKTIMIWTYVSYMKIQTKHCNFNSIQSKRLYVHLWDVMACWSWNCIQLWAEARRPFKVFPINSPFYLMVFRRISIMAKYLSFSTENWIIKLFSEIKVEINFVAVRCRKYWTRWREN